MMVSTTEFKLFQKLMYQETGVHLRDSKKTLVSNRLRKRLTAYGLQSYKKYYDLLTKSSSGRDEIPQFVDALTTHETYFFRNPEHFDYLLETILPEVMNNKRNRNSNHIRIWCAACSTGEEPYSLAILLQEKKFYEEWKFSIKGTDISRAVIQRAEQGIFKPYAVAKMKAQYKDKYFTGDPEAKYYHLNDTIKNKVSFHQLNLLESFPYGKVDIILCRNAMIYFNRESKQIVADNLYNTLTTGGYLIVGYADNFIQNQTNLQYIKPTVYKKNIEKADNKRTNRGQHE